MTQLPDLMGEAEWLTNAERATNAMIMQRLVSIESLVVVPLYYYYASPTGDRLTHQLLRVFLNRLCARDHDALLFGKRTKERRPISFFFEKVRFTPSNYSKNLIFNLRLQNWIIDVIQLSKPDKFGLSGGFVFLNKFKNCN